MLEKIILDMLTGDSVSVQTQQYTVVDGVESPIGQPHRKAYLNSTKGREEVQLELSTTLVNAILSIWGDTPTVIEEITQ